jgi:hypothetical protein
VGNGMKVLIIGAGRFGRAIGKLFTEFPEEFHQISILDPHSDNYVPAPHGVHHVQSLWDQNPDIVVLAYSAVPPRARSQLVDAGADISAFWEIELHHNESYMASILPFLDVWSWRLLVVATNPVDEWVNALSQLYSRPVVGLGSAFDSQRVRSLLAAMVPDSETDILRSVRVAGGHGRPIAVSGDRLVPQLVDAATWMSNALSVAFVHAPDQVAQTWWETVALRPFVTGLSGFPSRTHLVIPVEFDGVRAAGAFDVIVERLTTTVQIPEMSVSEQAQVRDHLLRMNEAGTHLASRLREHRPETDTSISIDVH